MSSATRVLNKLETEGFVYALSNRTRKKAANAPLKYVVSKTEENKRKMLVEYFDPLAKISHHVSSHSFANSKRTKLSK